MDPADLLGTAWRLASLNGRNLIEGSTVTLAIHNEHQVSGQAGCRDYVAGYEASGDDISFTFLAMIEADCPLDDALLEQEGRYTTILGWATDYRLLDAQMEILTERGEVLTFDRIPVDHEASLEAAPWTLTAFIEDKVVEEMPVPLPMPTDRLADTEITATFEDGTVSGTAGCNTYSAAYAVDGSFLRLETLAATEIACTAPAGIMEQEQRYLHFLRDVVTYRVHDNQLWLETGDGRALVFASYSQEP
jgi:heat shock protein HslJ